MTQRGIILVAGSKPGTVIRMEAIILTEEGSTRPMSLAVQRVDLDGRSYKQEIPGEKILGMIDENDAEGRRAVQNLGLAWTGKAGSRERRW